MSLVSAPRHSQGVAAATASSAPAPRPLIDYDFQSALLAPPKQRRVLWLMVGLIAAVIAALALFRIDVVVSANGKLVTSDRAIVIQPVETSVVRSIAVKMGQKVKAGDRLATLDPTFSAADRDELAAKLRVLDATFDRLDAEIAGRDYDPPDPNPDQKTQRDVFRQRQAEYAAKLDTADRKIGQFQADLEAHKVEAVGLQKQLRLARDAEGVYEKLVAKELASKLKLIEATQQAVDAQTKLDNNSGEQQKLAQQIAQAQGERNGFAEEWRRKLSEDMAQTRSERDGTAARLAKAQMRRDLVVMTAPRDGVVLEVADRPPGSVLREAETLMRLVPADDPLGIEVQIDPRDVARLQLGDPVTIKFEALPWQQFGLAHGRLIALSPDTVADDNTQETAAQMASSELKSQVRQNTIHYRARIELTETRFRNLPREFALRPGMRAVADIKIGRRSILGYLLNPITRVLGDSLHEP